METKTKQENDAYIEEMVGRAKKAQEPGELAKNPVVNSGDEVVERMAATTLQSAGYVYIYDTQTGEMSLSNRNMLRAQLNKKRPDGSTVFTTIQPSFKPKRGKLLCFLHSDSPNRTHYDELGLATCLKSNLTSPYQVTRHMQKRHQMEWQTIEAERLEAERQEDRQLRYAMLGKQLPVDKPVIIADNLEEDSSWKIDVPEKKKRRVIKHRKKKIPAEV